MRAVRERSLCCWSIDALRAHDAGDGGSVTSALNLTIPEDEGFREVGERRAVDAKAATVLGEDSELLSPSCTIMAFCC